MTYKTFFIVFEGLSFDEKYKFDKKQRTQALNNRKQYIQINNEEKANLLLLKCGVPQGSMLGPLFFLVTLMILDTIMFANDTNLFYSHKDINALFLKVNNELHKTNQWFILISSHKILKIQYIYFSINEIKSPFYFLN